MTAGITMTVEAFDGGPRVVVRGGSGVCYRLLSATLHEVAARVERGSVGEVWPVYVEQKSDRLGWVYCEVDTNAEERRALAVLRRAADTNTHSVLRSDGSVVSVTVPR